MTLSGTAAAINAALASSNYTGNSGFYGTDSWRDDDDTDGGAHRDADGGDHGCGYGGDLGNAACALSGSENAAISLAGMR